MLIIIIRSAFNSYSYKLPKKSLQVTIKTSALTILIAEK